MRGRRRITTAAVVVATLAMLAPVSLPATGAYFTGSSSRTDNTAQAATLPAITGLNASKTRGTSGVASTITWDAPALPAGSSAASYTVERSDSAAFLDPVTVYRGTSIQTTDTVGSATTTLRRATQVAGTGVNDGHFALIGGKVHRWGTVTRIGETGTGAWFRTGAVEEVTGWSDEIAELSAGSDHACALLVSGRAECVGYDDLGQLGNGDGLGSDVVATAVVDSGNVFGGRALVDIAAGRGFTCALDTAGTIGCWGANDRGQLGVPLGTTKSTVPVAVTGSDRAPGSVFAERKAVSLAAGAFGVCAAKEQGGSGAAAGSGHAVACWGGNPYGQLGEGVAKGVDSATPVDIADPKSVLTGVTEIAGAHGVFCVLNDRTDIANVACWGGGGRGVLGKGTSEERPDPQTIAGAVPGLTMLDVNGTHGCAAKASEMWCWGENEFGQLGNGATLAATRISSPVKVTDTSAVLAGGDIVSIGLSWFSTCAVSSTGVLGCWGQGTKFQLGAGTSTANSSTPVGIAFRSGATGTGDTTPVIQASRVVNSYGDNFAPLRSFDVGGKTVCALGNLRTWCWGDNSSGQAGVSGGAAAVLAPRIESVTGYSDSPEGYTVAVGRDFICTAVGVYCWGNNASGQLADGTRVSRSAASNVNKSWSLPDPNSFASGVITSKVVAGVQHSCGIWNSQNITHITGLRDYVVCWGANGRSQTGPRGSTSVDGAIQYVRSGPLATATVTQIAASAYGTCALTSGNVIACWGEGTAEPTVQNLPLGAQKVVKLVGGGADSTRYCALTDQQNVYCFTVGSRWQAQMWSELRGITDLSVGGDRLCAVAGGQVYCGSTEKMGPAQQKTARVGGDLIGRTAVEVESGASVSCASTTEAMLYCWGANTAGELGNGTTTASATASQADGETICAAGATRSGTSCSLVPSRTYYYRVSYGLAGIEKWVSAPTIAARS